MMDMITLTGLALILSFSGHALGEIAPSCTPDVAETCLTTRATQYLSVKSEYAENNADLDKLRSLCLSQIKPDSTGECFDQNTKLCEDKDGGAIMQQRAKVNQNITDMSQIKPDSTGECFDQNTKLCENKDGGTIMQQWASVNQNITDMCIKECPDMFDISRCKSLADTEGVRFSRFETFCSTFNESLRCVKDLLPTCKLGPQFYADLLEPNIMQYWQYICTSGCHNIDETVQVITKCADHIGKFTTIQQLCLDHGMFKTCVAESTTACPEVMSLIRFKYVKFDLVEKTCRPTTTSTTTPATTTSTTSTTTTEATTTIVPDVDPSLMEDPAVKLCFEKIDVSERDIPDQIQAEHVILISEIEACIHNISTNAHVPELMTSHGGAAFGNFYQRVKQEGWLVLIQTLSKCGGGQQGSDGCSGHRYGILQCNNTAYATSSSLSTSILVLAAAGMYWLYT